MAEPAARAILDTSVYLSFLRKNVPVIDLSFLLRPTLLYMSSVVFAELYAGAKNRLTLRQLERVYRTFQRLNRLAVPDKQVWFETGQVLQQLGARHGFETVGLSRLTHDVLIALTARRLGAVVYTRNYRNFERIRAIRDFHLSSYEAEPV
jgi:predicted nucleic acid-binding protein